MAVEHQWVVWRLEERTDTFDYYFSLGPSRSYQQVADNYAG